MLDAIGYKIRLKPNKTQIKLLYKFANHSRGLYNILLAEAERAYHEEDIRTNLNGLFEYYKYIKYLDAYSWLQDLSHACANRVAKDLMNAYIWAWKSGFGFPKFKSKRCSKLSFYQRTDRLKFSNDFKSVNITGIGYIKCIQGDYPIEGYCNPRVTFDGKYWYLSFSIVNNFECTLEGDTTDGLGIDLGVKDLAVLSNEDKLKNPNKCLPELNRLVRKYNRLQRQYSRKLEINKLPNGKVLHTKNSEKLRKELNLISRRIHNIKTTYYHNFTMNLMRTKPEFIGVEDIDIKGLKSRERFKEQKARGKMKYRVAKSMQQVALYEIIRQLRYKGACYSIPVYQVDRYFPSTKMCSRCKSKQDMTLEDRTYECPVCGLVIDRDLNAASNIREEVRRMHLASLA